MTMVWVATGGAVLGLLWYAGRLAGDVAATTWPEEAPLRLREERGRDQRLTQLVRLLAADHLDEAHRAFREVAERLAGGRPPDPRVARFVATPPLGDPDRYRRELAAAMARIGQS
jgi:hypothetical protein